jgi:hypothetical protein
MERIIRMLVQATKNLYGKGKKCIVLIANYDKIIPLPKLPLS